MWYFCFFDILLKQSKDCQFFTAPIEIFFLGERIRGVITPSRLINCNPILSSERKFGILAGYISLWSCE